MGQAGAYFRLAVVTLILALSGAAGAQEVPKVQSECGASVSCLRQMVQDLRDYRQYVEDQLALAKTLLQAANERISQQVKEIDGLRSPGPGPEKKDLPK